MNALLVLLAFAFPGDLTPTVTPVLAQQGAMDEHAVEAHEHEHEDFHEVAPRRESYLVYFYRALGMRYTLLFLLTGPLVFLGAVLVVALCRRPGPIAAFFPFVAIPLLIGLHGFFDGVMLALSVISATATSPKPAEIAMGISTAIVTPLVGLTLAAPSYLVLSIGLFVRSLLYRGPAKGA